MPITAYKGNMEMCSLVEGLIEYSLCFPVFERAGSFKCCKKKKNLENRKREFRVDQRTGLSTQILGTILSYREKFKI